MGKFEFNSQICTSREQSERLLALGLKKETADMVLCEPFDYEKHKYSDGYTKIVLEEGEDFCKEDIPAWSLHRLLMMLDYDVQTDGRYIALPDYGFAKSDNIYDNLCDCIEWLIKKGYFPKEYLED